MSDLVAHVPIARFTIVNGPSVRRCTRIVEELILNDYVRQTFTLTTPASRQEFRRYLDMATMFNIKPNGSFEFTAIFDRQVVSGIYAPHTRQGWFSRD